MDTRRHSSVLLSLTLLSLLFLGPLWADDFEGEEADPPETPKIDIEAVFADAEEALQGIEGIRLIEEQNGQVTLSGLTYRVSDEKKIHAFLSRYPLIQNKTTRAPEHPHRAQSQPTPKVSTASRPSSIKPSVFLEVALIEVKRSALEKLGTRLNSPISFDVGMQFNFLQSSQKMIQLGINDPIRVFLDIAMQAGQAKVHAKQSLVVQDGQWGEFQVGGEFPIKVVSGYVARVEFKQYGLILKFLPHLQSSSTSKVHLQIQSEVSEIDTGSMVDGIPVISKKLLKTQLFAPLNEMMAIGGLVRASQSKMTDSIPGLSAIPILGRLFESEDFKRQKSEAYFFITPRTMEKPWLPSPEL